MVAFDVSGGDKVKVGVWPGLREWFVTVYDEPAFAVQLARYLTWAGLGGQYRAR